MTRVAFQDRIPENHCYGCGPGNLRGLRIKSHWDGPDESVCVYRPEAHQCAGPAQFLNGGIIATLIDCHSVCTAVAHIYRCEGRELGSEPKVWCVTAEISIRYLRPTPLERPVELRARILESDSRKTRLSCTLASAGKTCAEGEVVAIRVRPSWRDGQDA